jgi:MFS transporter, PPP family, 3-phenylpropionic acid transporter
MTTLVASTRGSITPEFRATLYYFIQFMSGSVVNVYAGIWFADQGLTAGEIGILNALPVAIMLVLNVVVGRIADRADDWRSVIIVGGVLGGLIPIGLFFVSGFWPILIVWTLLALPPAAVGPVMDAATIRLTRRRGSQFGPIRAWGTVGYMIMLVAAGFIINWAGGGIFLPMFVGLSLLRALVAFQLPRFRAPEGSDTQDHSGAASRLRDAMKPFFILPLVGFSLVIATHNMQNAFQALLWKEQGFSADIIGPLLAVAAIAEAALMFTFGPIARRFSARSLILVSAGAAVIRWVFMAFEPGIGLLIPLQFFHSVTFALGYMGCMHFITNWTSDKIAAEAQGFFVMLQQSMNFVTLSAFGWLIGVMGTKAWFVAAAFAFVGAGMILVSIVLHAPKQAGEPKLV